MPRAPSAEVLISVDIEASGPSPGTGSMVAIGACLVDDPDTAFYRELQPIPGLPWDRGAERIHGLSRQALTAAPEPAQAMRDFEAWVEEAAAGGRPVFVGFNAPFDWMFVADYLHRFVGRNPFGHAALDLKALYMGRHRVTRWADTTKGRVQARYPVAGRHTHHALDDARRQADLCRQLLALPLGMGGVQSGVRPSGTGQRRP